MLRLLLPVVFFAAVAVGAGFLMSGDDFFDWPVALGLFGVAALGEGLRFWIRRGRTKARQSSEI